MPGRRFSRPPPRRHRRRRLALSLLASLALHLLALWIARNWRADQVSARFQAVRFDRGPALPRPAPYRAPTPETPAMAMAPSRPGPQEAPMAPALPPLREIPPAKAPPLQAPGTPKPGQPPAQATAPLPSVEQILSGTVQALAEDREGFARPWVPDADTTDAASARSRRARQIVLAAIEAMGGRDALLEIRDMRYGGRLHKAFGPRSRYVSRLPGGARLIYDGDRAIVDAFGARHRLRGRQVLRHVRRQAERWDFLSRYLGDGVRLEYLGTVDRRVPRRWRAGWERQRFLVVQVDDRRYGGTVFRAFFEARTGLLHHEDYPSPGDPARTTAPDWLFEGPASSALFYRGYERVGGALLWTEVSDFDYRKMYVRDRRPVSWAQIDPALFEPSTPDTTVVEPECCLSQSTLWLHVGLPSSAWADSVLPGAPTILTLAQRRVVSDDVRRVLRRELRRHGLTPRLQIAASGDPASVPAGDYLLAVRMYHALVPAHRQGRITIPPRPSRPVYHAALWLGGSGGRLMQDGPSTLFFVRGGVVSPPDCRAYVFHAYSVDNSGVYTQPAELGARARRTALKLASTLLQHEAGDDDLLYVGRQTFCQGPGETAGLGRR